MIVYLSEFIDPGAAEILRSRATVVDSFDRIEDVDAIILRGISVTADMMDRAKNLKVIAKHGVGVNTIDLAAAKQRGIKVIYTPTANADSVAEMVVGLFLSLARMIPLAHAKCLRGEFKKIAPGDFVGTELSGKALGVIGMGNIGMRIARIMANGFGAKVYGFDPVIDADEAARRGFKKIDRLEELLETADLITVNVPLIKSTEDLISGDMFSHFKSSALLVNAARGGIVNEDDLYEALSSGKLRGAACDSFVVEPPVVSNKLLSLPNFIATPHIGGNTEESLMRAGHEVVEETLAVLEGREPKHPVR